MGLLRFTPQIAFQSGAFSPAAEVRFYEVGTTTPLTVYLDDEATTPAAVPHVADGAGVFAQVYTSSAVKAVITASDGSAIATLEEVFPIGSTGAGAADISKSPVVGNSALNVEDAINANTERLNNLGNPSTDGKSILTQTTAQTKSKLGLSDLTQVQAEDDTSTVFGQVSGERIGQALDAQGATRFPKISSTTAEVSTTSGTSEAFTSIPAGVNHVEILLQGVSTTSTGDLLFQLGTDAAYVETGYVANSAIINIGAAFTTGFGVQVGAAARVASGVFNLRRWGATNVWVCDFVIANAGGTATGGGYIDITDELTSVKVIPTAGDFDAGKIIANYRY